MTSLFDIFNLNILSDYFTKFCFESSTTMYYLKLSSYFYLVKYRKDNIIIQYFIVFLFKNLLNPLYMNK